MAFSEAQRAKIRLYMGWPARFFQEESALEQSMNAVESEVDTYNEIVVILTRLDDIDTRITACYTRLKAMQVGAIKLPGQLELGALRSEGMRVASHLASILGIEIRNNYWTAAPYEGRAGSGGMQFNYSNNVMKQG